MTVMPRGYKLLSCSTQLSIKFQLLLKGKLVKNALNYQKLYFLLINVEMLIIVSTDSIIYEQDKFEYDKSFITSRPVSRYSCSFMLQE